MKNSPTPEEIVQALRETGFVFEQEVATTLEKMGFHVETNWPFPDNLEGKSREIDIRAIQRLHRDETARLSVFVELLVECKDTFAPWAFIRNKKNSRELERPEPREYVFPAMTHTVKGEGESYAEVASFVYHNLANLHYYYKEDSKRTQFVKIVNNGKNGWTANRDGIHDGIVLRWQSSSISGDQKR